MSKTATDKLAIRIMNFICNEMSQDKAVTKSVVLSAMIRALENLKIKNVKTDENMGK